MAVNVKALLGIIFVFIGCCSNVVFLELIIKLDPGAGNLITFSQFAFIALEGLIFTSKFFTKRPKIAIKDYLILVALFFATNVCNNYAFNFNIPMPLHMIFRSGSLLANMIMGIILLKKRYNLRQYTSVAMITAGIVLCTLVSSGNVKDNTHPSLKAAASNTFSDFFWWSVGIGLLSLALLVSSYMGIYQEVIYKRCGKHPQEALFYTHILPLPGFLFMFNNIAQHLSIAFSTEAIVMPPVLGISVQLPAAVFYLICNMVTQYVCISAVYVLTTECASLTVTLIVTLRKFVSLLFSIIYFRNPFTVSHWLGTILVFVGTILFANVVPQVLEALSKRRAQATKTSGKKVAKKVN